MVGGEVKQRLSQAGYSSDDVVLLAMEEASSILTEYGDEARIVARAAEEDLRDHRLVCFCGDPLICQRFATTVADSGNIVVDCTDAWVDDPQTHLGVAGIGLPGRPLPASGIVIVPAAPVLLLASLLNALGTLARDAVATLLLPASQAGESGARELALQAAAILNFEKPAREVLGRRLAFDIWPADRRGRSLEQRFAAQLEELGLAPISLSVLWASVFHAHSASVFLPHAAKQPVLDALVSSEICVETTDPGKRPLDSPVRVAGEPGIRAGAVWTGSIQGTWLWVVQDNHHAVADAALRTIQALLEVAPAR